MIGAIGSFLLAICSFPLMIQTIRRGYDETNIQFFYAWYLGECFMLYHVVRNVEFDFALLFNYGVNVLFLTVVLYYRLYPRKDIK